MVLRRANQWSDELQESSAGMAAEAAVIKRVEEYGGVPVPTVFHVLSDDIDVGEGYIMAKVEGETIPRKILRDKEYAKVRPKLAHQCGLMLARIHQVPVTTLPQLRQSSAADEVRIYLKQYRDQGVNRPIFELAFRWLQEHCPVQETLKLVHGDFRNGNLMISQDGIAAVLDWELAHLGDPMEDLGMLCVNSWRFGNIDHAAGGFGSYQQLIDGYEAGGGAKVDINRLRYWQIFKTLMWGVVCDANAIAFSNGKNSTLERAAIGRRASEVEIDLMQLLSPRF